MTFLSRSTLAKVAVGKNRDCIRAATCIFNLGPFVCQPCQFVMLRIVIRNIHVHTLHRNRKNIPCELLSERTLGTCYTSPYVQLQQSMTFVILILSLTSVTTADIIPEWIWMENGQLVELSEKDLNQLQAEYGSLQAEYGSLQAEYGSLQEEYGSLQEEHGSLQADSD